MEPLVYLSPLYLPELQSIRLFTLQEDRTRPYFLNTPRLVRDSQVDWQVPFVDPRVDELYRLDLYPRSEGDIRELLGVGSNVDLLQYLSSDSAKAIDALTDACMNTRGHKHRLRPWRVIAFYVHEPGDHGNRQHGNGNPAHPPVDGSVAPRWRCGMNRMQTRR